jgi:putative transposase
MACPAVLKAFPPPTRIRQPIRGQHRARYRSSRPADAALRGRLRDLGNERRRFGYRRLFVLLRREGKPSGINRIYRRYRKEGLAVRKRRARRKAAGTRAPIVVEARPNARWSLDFVHDQVRQRPALPHPQHRRRRHQGMPGGRSGDVDLGAARGARTDGNRRVKREVRNDRVRPWQRVHLQRNARREQGHSHRLALYRAAKNDAERLHREFQWPDGDKLLNETLFFDLDDARAKITNWVADYNIRRPHSSLKYLTPRVRASLNSHPLISRSIQHSASTDGKQPFADRRLNVSPTEPPSRIWCSARNQKCSFRPKISPISGSVRVVKAMGK